MTKLILIFLAFTINLVYSDRKRAIVFGIDGFLTKCFNYSQYPGFNYVVNQGSYTFKARTALYSSSGPGWSNILCAQSSEETGITDNDWWATWVFGKPYPVTAVTGTDQPLPCIFQTIKNNNSTLKTAAIFDWIWFNNLGNNAIPGSIDNEILCAGDGFDQTVTCDASAYNSTLNIINSTDFDFLFIHFDSLDEAGHTFNFCSDEYVNTIKVLDNYLSGIINALKQAGIYNETYLIVTSDHGASYNTTYHGVYKDDENLLVPWMIIGPNVKQGYEIQGNIKNRDTSPTVIQALGLQQNPIWRARPVSEVFNSTTSSEGELKFLE